MDRIVAPPPQPGEDTWTFIGDLQTPLWSEHDWTPREPLAGEADLRQGVAVAPRFPDPEGLLDTAYADLAGFLAAGGVSRDGGFPIETGPAETSTAEAYRIEVTAQRCRILAADTEGVRRGLFHVEDMMMRAGGLFLPLGVVERKPFIKARISRCFYGPINRPPKNRDELMDDVDYYPERYLNRLAHEGVNGLWLTVKFTDLCRTTVVPEFGQEAEQRLAKLRRTVETCRRYGIRIYLLVIEPACWEAGHPALKQRPELGSRWSALEDKRLFCPASEVAQQYLYEATNSVFTAVPHLGGLINISHGERYTHCLGSVAAISDAKPACPVCAEKAPWEILHAVLAPMARGIRDAAPDAELIAWLYMPYEEELADWVYEIPRHVPEGVVLQFNFETGVTKEVFGKERKGGDYWLSTPGPSPRFERIARAAAACGAAVSAKIQTGCSHEVATVPYVPVPGLLYRKFRAMRELGVTHTMLCWYFGNCPGLMNKAAGALSFEPFPDTEDDFLRGLAEVEWGEHAGTVASAWGDLAEGYGHFPLTNYFQYYGPMHDGPVWPLLLDPRDEPLAPTWQIASPYTLETYPPSGDRIGECLAESHTVAEVIELCRLMADGWTKGVDALRRVEGHGSLTPQQRLNVGVARALGVQFRSGLNILRFYDLRERMRKESPDRQAAMLDAMERIVKAELENDAELLTLCRADSRLGFHSEAEGYKYYPEKIRWRMAQLDQLLQSGIPALRKSVERGDPIHPEFDGRAPEGPCAESLYRADCADLMSHSVETLQTELAWESCGQGNLSDAGARATRWACAHDGESLYLWFQCAEPDMPAVAAFEDRMDVNARLLPESGHNLLFKVEPRRLWPCLTFGVTAGGARLLADKYAYKSRTQRDAAGWSGWLRIPFSTLGADPTQPGPFRVNVIRILPGADVPRREGLDQAPPDAAPPEVRPRQPR